MHYVLMVGMAAATLLAFLVPDADQFQKPELARIFFFHFPSALICSVFIFLSGWFGFWLLRTRDMKWDVRNAASVEMGALYGVFTMATGILFSEVQWGTWWQWDPRQTSFLLVLAIFGAGIAIRGAFSDERRRATISAAYSVASLLPSLFLIFVFPRLPHIEQMSFHPSQTVTGGLLDGWYRVGVLSVGFMLAWLTVIVYRMRVRVGELEFQREQFDGSLEAVGGGAAPHRVVRAVSVSEERRDTPQEV
ncbi:MAG TPA: cytochrome c biogenesis protein CcsA [Fimbriimonadaceae bacterium]|nr:cytochrome c biogenesis protein CcsA [Fimbriimonadaceae bacterium]